MAHDIFLQVEGVTGDSVSRGHERWIDATNWAWEIRFPSYGMYGSTPLIDAGVDVTANSNHPTALSVQARSSSATPVLASLADTGGRAFAVTLDVMRVGSAAAVLASKIVLAGARVGRVSISADVEGMMDSYEFTYTTARISYYPALRNGSAGAPVSATISSNPAT